MKKLIIILILTGIGLGAALSAQVPKPTIKTTKVGDNLYQFFIYLNPNSSVNIYAFVGEDGVLMIDSGFDVSVPLVQLELAKIGHTKIKYIINTHNDWDHTLGNAGLGKDATIICHENCKKILEKGRNQDHLPDMTFDEEMTIQFNGEKIRMIYLPGHTDNDIVVLFKNADIAFLGDLAFSNSFPVIHGHGNLDLLLKTLATMERIFTSKTLLLVSHGEETNLAQLKVYRKMIVETSKIVKSKIVAGYTPEKSKAEDILKAYTKWNSKVFDTVNKEDWIDSLYQLTEEGKQRSAARKIRKAMDDKGLDVAKQVFRKLKKSRRHFFIEGEFNALGYDLLRTGKIKKSLFIFRMNIQLFPKSWNAYDSLGEACLATGDKAGAKKYYGISVKLNPGNSYGLKVLKELAEAPKK